MGWRVIRRSLYAEQAIGKEAGLRAIDEFAVGALMYDNSAPVAQSARLVALFQRVSLRGDEQGGDAISHAASADGRYWRSNRCCTSSTRSTRARRRRCRISRTWRWRRRTRAQSQEADPPNLQGFFAQWLNSTGIPEFTLEYVVYRTRKGFRIVGQGQATDRHVQHADAIAHRHRRKSGNQDGAKWSARSPISWWKLLAGRNPAGSRSIRTT